MAGKTKQSRKYTSNFSFSNSEDFDSASESDSGSISNYSKPPEITSKEKPTVVTQTQTATPKGPSSPAEKLDLIGNLAEVADVGLSKEHNVWMNRRMRHILSGRRLDREDVRMFDSTLLVLNGLALTNTSAEAMKQLKVQKKTENDKEELQRLYKVMKLVAKSVYSGPRKAAYTYAVQPKTEGMSAKARNKCDAEFTSDVGVITERMQAMDITKDYCEDRNVTPAAFVQMVRAYFTGYLTRKRNNTSRKSEKKGSEKKRAAPKKVVKQSSSSNSRPPSSRTKIRPRFDLVPSSPKKRRRT
eukprot:845188_1